MPTNFPGSLDTTAQLSTSRADSTPLLTNHAFDHDTVNGAVLGVEAKLGFGSSTPTVGVVLTGTGTGSSAWQSGISFNAKAFGAIDDGSTVNTTAIQNAINACSSAGGGSVWFPGHGTFITGNLSIPAGVSLRGDGATLKAVAGLVGQLLTPMGNNVRISGLTLDGNANNNTIVGFGVTTSGFIMDRCTLQHAHYGLQAGNAQNDVWILDNTITDCNAICVSFQANVSRATIRGNTVTTSTSGGISFFPAAPAGATDIVIDGNTVRNITALPIECQYGERVVVSRNVVSGNGTNGLSIGQCTHVSITGNVVRDQSNEAIELAVGASVVGNSNYTVSGNTLTNCGMGIIADQMTNIAITGNTISTTTVSDGIRLTGPVNATVSGNTIVDPFISGVSILNDSSSNPAVDVHVTGNTFVFRTARTNSPTAVNIGSSQRTVFENNLVEVATDISNDSLFYVGPVIFTGTPIDATVRSNTIISTVSPFAHHSAIRVQAGVTTAGLHVVGNRVKNFEEGINTSPDASTDVIVQNNSVVGGTIPYTLNAAHQPVAGTGVPGTLFIVAGVPPSGLGVNGDFALRSDGTEAGHTLLYHKQAAAWVTTAA